MLDACLFNDNHRCGIIDASLPDAKKKLAKIKFAYDNLPDWLRAERALVKDATEEIEFSNGSGIVAGTSHRGDTLQKLHISEFGKIAARYPEKALEIKTGALNAVHAGQQIFVESTAEGRQGEFFELCELARKLKQEDRKLTPLDPKFHFYSWFDNPDYALSQEHCDNTSVTADMAEYFAKIENECGTSLSPGQKAWYVKKHAIMGDEMKREFPSTPAEAFEASMEGAIYQKQMGLVRQNKQITHLPHEPSQQVYTFWDLGKGSDYTSIWFFQQIGHQYRFIDFHESHNEGWDFYAKLLNSKPYTYAEHVLPWDGDTKIAGKKMSTAKKDLLELGVRPIRTVPQTKDVWADIKGKCRSALPRCFFDETRCADGIKHLDNYRRSWDEKLGQWRDKPRHDEACHAADSFRTFAMGYQGRVQELIDHTMRNQHQQADTEYDELAF